MCKERSILNECNIKREDIKSDPYLIQWDTMKRVRRNWKRAKIAIRRLEKVRLIRLQRDAHLQAQVDKWLLSTKLEDWTVCYNRVFEQRKCYR